MRVRVLFFGRLREVFGRSEDALDLEAGAAVRDVIEHYSTESGELSGLRSSLAVAVNQTYAEIDRELHADDEVALLPPVSGGAPLDDRRRVVAIVREAIDTGCILERIKHAEDGAAVVFEGVVRNQTRGRKTLYLDYEAYEEMALREMNSLAEQAPERFAVREVSIVHRLGRLRVGETSVLIVVASAHRAAAFDACRWLIDTLKRTVPIWKKEFFEDGAVWADGEPFPAEIPRASGSPNRERASK